MKLARTTPRLLELGEQYDVVVLADAAVDELAPLVQHTCQALLPVVGKPIVEHVIESIVPLNPQRVLVVGCGGFDELTELVSSGERWGLSARMVVSRSNCSHEEVLQKFNQILGDNVIVIDCLSVRDFDVIKAVSSMQKLSCAFAQDASGKPAGLALYRRNFSGYWPPTNTAKAVSVESMRCFATDSLSAYFDSNLTLVSPEHREHLRCRGREAGLGIVYGAGSRISPSSVKLGRVYAGSCTVAHANAEFSGTVVLGNNVVIDKQTVLRDAMVLDNTYVGSRLTIERSIVSGKRLISVDTGSVVDIDDPHFLTHIEPYDVPELLSRMFDRVTGVVALVLSLPLWVFACVVALILNPRNPVLLRRWVGSTTKGKDGKHRQFSALSFNCTSAFLRNLPLVLAVASGHVRWFGVSLLTPEEYRQRTDGWETARDNYPTGLFGPTQLELDSTAPLAERLLTDAMYSEWSLRVFAKAVWRRASRPMSVAG